MLVRCLQGLGIATALLGAPGASYAAPPVPTATGTARSSAPSRTQPAPAAGPSTNSATASVAPLAGRLKVLTYNVAGLPEGLSQSRPIANLPQIGKLMNRYDLVLVQEDFAYPEMLRDVRSHAYSSPAFVRGERLHFGDGLSQFARSPFHGYEREAWVACHGVVDSYFDCLTPKGVAFSRQELAPGVTIDVYNLHMDAGASPGDRQARFAQFEQLAAAVKRRSPGHAVLVGGDFNIGHRELERLQWLGAETGLEDSCLALRCNDPRRIDRVLFRSSDTLKISPRSWRVDRRFVDSLRRPLSDHLAVAVELDWSVNADPPAEASKAGMGRTLVAQRGATTRTAQTATGALTPARAGWDKRP